MQSDRDIRVMCVDDNELVADALRRRVTAERALVWAGSARGDEDDILARVQACRPDVLLMDIDIPGVDTFALMLLISATCPNARILMLSGHIEVEYLDRGLDSGAWGYMSKNDDAAALMTSIREVSRGVVVLSDEVRLAQQRHERDA